jgi:hypothetical protein
VSADLEALQYPIGRFVPPSAAEPARVRAWIAQIAALPRDLRAAVEPLDARQLDTPYRPGGWSGRQVVQHLADSHMNSVIRFKWALTEERPLIKAYFEERWAELPDVRAVPVSVALDLLDSLHARWVGLLSALGTAELAREFVHPQSGPISLGANVGVYAWHGRHHLAHIEGLARRAGWR